MTVDTLSDLLRDSARAWPERIAVGNAARDQAVTYRDLDALVADLASQLNRLGIARGSTVGIFSDNCIEYVLALFAVVSAGAAAAPVNPGLAPPQMSARLAGLRADATIVPAHLYDGFVATHGALADRAWSLVLTSAEDQDLRAELSVSPALGRESVETPKLDPPVSGDVAILMLTSGTTAAPKVVPLKHANLLASINGIRTVYRLTPDDATLLVMPLFHGHGLIAGLLATLASGGAAYVPTGGRFHAGSFWADVVATRATWFTAVPTMHQILLARAGSDHPEAGLPASEVRP